MTADSWTTSNPGKRRKFSSAEIAKGKKLALLGVAVSADKGVAASGVIGRPVDRHGRYDVLTGPKVDKVRIQKSREREKSWSSLLNTCCEPLKIAATTRLIAGKWFAKCSLDTD